MGQQKSDFGLQGGGGDTVHKGILEFVLCYIRFYLQGGVWGGGGAPPPPPPPRRRPQKNNAGLKTVKNK